MLISQLTFRELRDNRQRYEALMADLKKKEKHIKELQNRLDSNDGCKLNFIIYLFFLCTMRCLGNIIAIC